MNLFSIVVRGIRGRKRDSLTLGSVLFLSFLFLVLSSVLLSSVAYTSQQQRQAIYGNWQVLYHGADADVTAAYANTDGFAEMEVIGNTMDKDMIASIDQQLFDNAGFVLVEGRLPEGEDEILLVQGRIGSEKAVGDTLSIAYEYDYMQTAILPDESQLQNAILTALTKPLELADGSIETLETRRAAFEAYVEANYSYDEANSVLRIHWPNGGNGQLAMEPGTSERAALEELFADHYDRFFVNWAQQTSDAYRTHSYRMSINDLEVYEDFTFRVQSGYQLTMLTGEGYQDQREQEIAYKPATEMLTMYRNYTVVGIIAPYADHWDARGYHLPDAFVSDEAAAQQLEAIRCAESFYLEGASDYERSSVLLFWNAAQDARVLAEQLLPQYNAVQRPGVRLEGFAADRVGGATGAVFGLDPATGKSIAYQATLSNGHYYLIDNGTWYFMGDDPNDPANMPLYAEKLLPYPAETVTVDMLDDGNTRPFRINTYAYPAAGGTEESLQTLLSGVLVGVAACATFQIFWVQLRRRKTRLATLMSIGATDGQILGMLLLEVLLLLFVAGVTGVALGFALVHLLLGTVVQATYWPDWAHVWSGIGSATAAVLIGALIPMLLTLRTPLTGREQSSSHTLRLKEARGEPRMQRYWRIVLRNMTVNRGKTALQCAFAWLLATICLLTLFLCHNAFGDYRREVEQTARPDYELEAPYAMSGAYLEDLLADSGMDGKAVYGMAAGNVYLHTDKLLAEGGSPIVRTLHQHPQGEDLFRTLEDGTPGFTTRIVGAMEGSSLMEQILSLVPEGTVDVAELLTGEACILLVPRYTPVGDGVQTRSVDLDTLEEMSRDERAGALLELSFDPQMTALTAADDTIRAGEYITLTGYTQKPGDSGMVETVRTVQTRVAAVVSVLDVPMWPFSESESAYWVLSGNKLVYRIYERTGTRMTGQQAINHRVMAKLFYPDCYGRTMFYFTNPAEADGIAYDTLAANFAEEYGLDFDNLRLLNERVRSDAIKTSMMFLLLGLEMILVVLTILMATAASSVEQDRWRFGTLQAIGVSGGQLARGQILQALGVGALACLAANLALGLLLLISAVLVNLGQGAFGIRVLMTLVENLQDYPWGIHLLLCAGYLVVYVFAQSRPIFRVSREDPIKNIRS